VCRRGPRAHEPQWISDERELWLSAVVPTPGDIAAWSLLPLAAGWAVLSVVRGLGLPTRGCGGPTTFSWATKLAGILVRPVFAEVAVVGIGLNVANHPEETDPELTGEVTCLADLLPHPPLFHALIVQLLAALTGEHHRLSPGNAGGLCRDLNGAWCHLPGAGHLLVDAAPSTGTWTEIDPSGALLVRDAAGEMRVLPAHRVERLREVFPI